MDSIDMDLLFPLIIRKDRCLRPKVRLQKKISKDL